MAIHLGSFFRRVEAFDRMTVGQKIAQYRKLRNITQTELAVRLNVHQTQIARWEKDRARPRHDYISQLAEVLDVPIQELTAAEAQDLSGVEDEELRALLLRVNELNPRQAQALKTMLGDMLRLTRFQKAINE
jgi:transcriptional regulator with XRE-family HTH domain